MENDQDVQRNIGRMETEIKSLKSTLDEVRFDLKEIKRSFDELRGGTKFMMSIAATTGAIIAFVFSWLSLKH